MITIKHQIANKTFEIFSKVYLMEHSIIQIRNRYTETVITLIIVDDDFLSAPIFI